MLNEAQERAIDAVFATSNWEAGHVRQVRELAVALFDSLRPLHGLNDTSIDLLEAAALLHDIGYPTDPANHHKVSARMIRTRLGPPFSPDEIAMIALLARYHRKTGPKARHRRFSELDERQRRAVAWLAGILRVADGLDRDHVSAVRWLASAVLNDRLNIYVSDDPIGAHPARTPLAPAERLASSIEGGLRKRDVLERVAGLPVTISAR